MYRTLKRQIILSFVSRYLSLSLFYLLPPHILILLHYLDSTSAVSFPSGTSLSGVFFLFYSSLCYCKN